MYTGFFLSFITRAFLVLNSSSRGNNELGDRHLVYIWALSHFHIAIYHNLTDPGKWYPEEGGCWMVAAVYLATAVGNLFSEPSYSKSDSLRILSLLLPHNGMLSLYPLMHMLSRLARQN